MKIIFDPKRLKLKSPVVALGTFDGVHRGHQKVIKSAVRYARQRKLPSVAITFDPHPQLVVSPERGLHLLTTLKERADLISALGVDFLYVIRFDHRLQNISYREFVKKILVDKLKAQKVFVGYDYAFGYRRTGNVASLKELGEEYGFSVSIVSPVKVGKEIAKSSTLRKLLSRGKIKEATRMLGRPYSLGGKVISGSGRGHALGYPTANLKLPSGKLLPAQGIYAGKVLLNSIIYNGVFNIGARPTFGEGLVAVEVHVLDFSGNIRKKYLKGELLARLRDEIQFADAEVLKQQIGEDIRRARGILHGVKSRQKYIHNLFMFVSPFLACASCAGSVGFFW